MSAHGDVRINGARIATWRARRCYALVDAGEHDYECEYVWFDAYGRRLGAVQFTVVHAFRDGAAVLASKVLAKASAKQPPTKPLDLAGRLRSAGMSPTRVLEVHREEQARTP